MSGFVIVGSQRSGTTLLRSSLAAHSEILCLGEVFYINRAVRHKDGKAMGKNLSAGFSSWREYSYQNYIDDSPFRKLRHWCLRAGMTREYLDYMYSLREASSDCKIVGFKMMVNQNKKFPAVLPYLLNHNIKVVHMYRENPFDILLSRLMLAARGYAHSASDAGEAMKVYVNTDTLIADLHDINKESEYWTMMFQDKNPYCKISYEHFVNQREQSSKELLDFLEVDSSVPLTSELVKVNTAPVFEMLENFSEVKACLDNSPFERYL